MLDALFKPRAVAVIGASAKELHIGNQIIRNLLEFGFKGPIYPINPKADKIRGVKAYRSILDVPTDVDVVHMAIPASFVPQAIEDCGTKGVKMVVLNGGGFSETGSVGAAIEEDCMIKAKQHNIRIFGPNCQGIINTDPDVRAYCNFTFTRPEPGPLSIVALSGGVASLIHQAFADMGIGTRLYASNGNACDVSIPEIIRYFGDDEGTQVIVLYVEGLKEPRQFLETASKVTARKPILAMKAGRTEEGAKAASSHTGGIAKQGIATDLIFEKAGIISFRDEAELCQAGAVFATQPIPKGDRVGVITNTGGPAVIATDMLAASGLKIPPLSKKSLDLLKEKLFPEASINNPLDVLATAEARHFRVAMDTMIEEDAIDSIYINFVTAPFVDPDSIAEEIVKVNRQHKKPIICNLMTDKNQWPGTVNILKDGGVPIFDFPGAGAKALAAITKYGRIRQRKKGKVIQFNDTDRAKAKSIIEKAQTAGRSILSAAEVYEILEAYGMPVADRRIVHNSADAEKAAMEIGFPVVVKIESESVIHKSDVHGVVLNLNDVHSVRSALKKMSKRFRSGDLKFLVQKYLPKGKEIIVGAKAEEGLGHLLMLGLGGIHVELMNDVTLKLSPVTEIETEEMLSSLKASKILDGTRGNKGVDKKGIAGIIQRVSQMVTELPEIGELDLNPVIAFENSVCIVDARIIL